VALSGTLVLVPALLLAQTRAPVSRVKTGAGPSFAAAIPDLGDRYQGDEGTTATTLPPAPAVTTTVPATSVPAVAVAATSPPALSIVVTPAAAVFPAPTTLWRPSTTIPHRTVTTAPPTTRPPVTLPPTTAPPTHSETGQASWYSAPAGFCAQPTLPLGTLITVTNLATGATATCTVEGRGPFGGGNRIVDLDQATFAKLAPLSVGVIDVRIAW
jgi:carboxypeptidase N regulatory subunit